MEMQKVISIPKSAVVIRAEKDCRDFWQKDFNVSESSWS